MAIGDNAVSTSPAAVAFRLRWDVFLSFRGEDTRDGFVKILYESLDKKGVRAFRDDDGLNRGDEIAPSLLEAIDDSAAAIVVLSPRYADSRWCLEELAKICECPNKLILPVFHRVDPSDVRRQKGPFEEHFRVHEQGSQNDKVLRWRRAMEKVGGTAGWVFKDSRVLGFHGMGGVGKTTLAKALFNKLVGHFELHSFIPNMGEVSAHLDGQILLQNKLIHDLSNGSYPPVNDVREGFTAIKRVVYEKRVLVVLDDVEHVRHLNALMSEKERFYEGSRIIITTRDTEVLLENLVDLRYEVRELNRSQALQLFSYHALRREKPPEKFLNLSEQIVSLTGNLPLALEVFGSMLFDKRRIEEWNDAIRKLKEIRPANLQDVLKISYNALDEQEKCIFLDIACLLVKMDMDRDYAIDILKGCGFEAEIAISVLAAKSLIKITQDNTLWMHDQVSDMGRQIVKHEDVVDPCMRSRLWNRDEIMTVFLDDERSKFTQGIVLDFKKKSIVKDPDGSRISWNNLRNSPNFTNAVSYFKERCKEYRNNQAEKSSEVKICTKPLRTMANLRLLETNYVNLEGKLKFPADLRWLQWKGCPLKHLPSDFCALGLAVLDLSDSKIKRLWGRYTENMADNLMVLNLHGCFNLAAIPNLSGNRKLEKLILGYCVSLTEMDEHIGNMNTLIHLNLKGCSNLIKLPTDVSGLKRLQDLILSGCSKLKELPENIGSMKSLKQLLLDETAIKNLPESIFRLTLLEKLSLNRCSYLKRLPLCIGKLCSLKELSLNGSGLEELPDSIGSLANLEILSVMWCTSLSVLPDSIGNLKLLTQLLILASPIKELPDCVGSLPNLKELSIGKGQFLSTLPRSIEGLRSLVELQIEETSITHLPDQIGTLKSLKKLDLLKCRSLRSLPESVGGMLSLNTLFIYEAKIRELPESVGLLENLTMLKLTFCRELLKLPASIGKLKFLYRLLMEDTAVTELPESFGMLSSLMVLCVSKKPQVGVLRDNNAPTTSAISISQEGVFFPTSFSNLSSLSELDARARNVSGKIPDDFEKLASLEILNLGYNHFFSLPSSLRGLSILKKLLLPHCSELKSLPPLPSSLLELNVAHCIALESISDLSNLENLEELNLTNCEKVKDIPGLECLKSLKRLYMNCCHTCSSVARKRLAKGSFRKIRNLSMPGSKIPDWFSQDVVTFSERKNRPIKGVIVGVVVSLNHQIQDDLRDQLPGIVDIQAKILKQDFPIFTTALNLGGVPNRSEDQVHLCRYSDHHPLVTQLKNGYKIFVTKREPPYMKGVELKKWGLYLIYEGDDDYEGDEESLSGSQQSISEKLVKFFGTHEDDDCVSERERSLEAENSVQETCIRAQITSSSNQAYLPLKFIALSFLLLVFSWFYLRMR
ncbi:TIR-NBS-LRR-like protein [Trema orientale]|uniref:TIR-NBS-LRR-like protein n=1 Tax=Trema orientale TaxID=63057 RepID=A0A2P5BY83_TREOI|nr:TIR-NBS-LRR-like protein [Trema orientale]